MYCISLLHVPLLVDNVILNIWCENVDLGQFVSRKVFEMSTEMRLHVFLILKQTKIMFASSAV